MNSICFHCMSDEDYEIIAEKIKNLILVRGVISDLVFRVSSKVNVMYDGDILVLGVHVRLVSGNDAKSAIFEIENV